jgi:hypothetical protein
VFIEFSKNQMIETNKKSLSVDTILLSIIMLVAIILRFWNFSEMPYMHDELSALARTNFSSISELIEKGARIDGHPAGVQVFLYYWTKAFGYNEMVVKTPFIICGLLSILVAYKISKLWFNSTVGLLVAVFMATMQFMIMYSQIARPYISGMFFSLLMVWCWSNYLFGSDKKNKWLIGYILSTACCAYDHHFALLFAIIVGMTTFFFLSKNTWKGFVFAAVGVFVLYIPHLGIFFYQLSKGGVGGEGGWLGKPDSDWLLMLLRYAFHYSYWMYGLVVLIVLFSVFKRSGELKTNQKFRIISLLWFLAIFVIGYFYSIKVNPVLQFSTLIFVFPFFLIFLFSLFGELNNSIKSMIVGAVLVVGTSTLVFSRKHLDVFYHQPYQQQITFTNAMINKIGDEKKATIELFMPPFFKDLYFKKYDKTFDFIYFNGYQEAPNPKAFNSFVTKQNTDYFIAGNLPLLYYQIIKENYPYIVNKEEGFTYMVYCFSKIKPQQEFSETVVFTEKNTFDVTPAHWNDVADALKKDSTGNVFYQMDSNREYSATFSAKLKDIVGNKHTIINASVTATSADTSSNPLLVLSINDGEESIVWASADYKWYNNKQGEKTKIMISQLLAGFDFKKHPDAELKIYVWNKNKTQVAIDDFNIEVIADTPIIYGLYESIEE